MIDNIIAKVTEDPLYLIMAIVLLIALAFIYFRQYVDNILFNIIKDDENLNNEEVVEKFVLKVSDKLNDISTKVKKRKKLINLLSKFIQSKFVKKYLIKLLDKNPNKEEDTVK